MTASSWKVQTTDLDRLDVRVNMWWGEEGPEDALLCLRLREEVGSESFARRLRTLAPGDAVELTYEIRAGGAVCHFPEALVTDVALNSGQSNRRQQMSFRSNRIPERWQTGEHAGDLEITFCMPGEGYMFGPNGPCHQMVPLPVDDVARRSFVLESIRELEDAGAWECDPSAPEPKRQVN